MNYFLQEILKRIISGEMKQVKMLNVRLLNSDFGQITPLELEFK